MSKKRVSTWCFVIDASIASEAGSLESSSPRGTRCRDFLLTIRSICHRMAWSKSIKAEWDRHQTLFARQWLVSMLKLKKLRPVKDEPLKELREAIEGSSQDSNVVKNMLKDVHLIEAALATDTRIASLDDKARRHFNRLEATQKPLRRVVWVNPAIKSEQVVEWLKEGAKAQRSRKLNHKRQGKRGRKRHPG